MYSEDDAVRYLEEYLNAVFNNKPGAKWVEIIKYR